jgi:hypothetical protein
MVRHVFLWKVRPGASAEEIFKILNTLPDRVPDIRNWTLGSHRGAPGSSGDLWEHGLVCDFDSFEALKAYSEHPYHVEVVEKLTPMFSARAVCDFALD